MGTVTYLGPQPGSGCPVQMALPILGDLENFQKAFPATMDTVHGSSTLLGWLC